MIPLFLAATLAASCINRQLPGELGAQAPMPPGPATPLAVISFAAPKAPLRLAVAADDWSRELGLMCETNMRRHHGMLFAFDRDDRQEFWMKNTLIPLDMVWVRGDGTVDTVAANVPASSADTPDDQVARRTGYGRYVIELPAGEAGEDGLVRGVRVHRPRLSPTPL